MVVVAVDVEARVRGGRQALELLPEPPCTHHGREGCLS